MDNYFVTLGIKAEKSTSDVLLSSDDSDNRDEFSAVYKNPDNE